MNLYKIFILLAMVSLLFISCDIISEDETESETLEFEATPTGLTAAPLEDLNFTELAIEQQTTILEPSETPGTESNVTLTSHTAVYQHEREEPTLLDDFLQSENSLTAVVLTPAELGIHEITLSMLEERPILAGDAVSLIVPAGARNDGEITPDELILLVPGTAISHEQVTVPTSIWVPGPRWFPESRWIPGRSTDGSGDEYWYPGDFWGSRESSDLRVLISTGERSFESIFGHELTGGDPVDEGTLVSTENVLFATTADGTIGGPIPGVSEVFNTGQPAPMGGAGFRLEVFTTPDAEVGGQSVNPVSEIELREFLTSEAEPLPGVNVDEDPLPGVNVNKGEWLAGPEELEISSTDSLPLLGRDTDIRSFGGVVSGENGPWGVIFHLSRVEHEGDIVFAAGTQVTPVGTADVWENGEATAPVPQPYWREGGTELSIAAFRELHPINPFQ